MLNFGIGGDRIENVLWRSNNLPYLSSVQHVVILCATNNLHKDSPCELVNGLIATADVLKKKCNNPKIIICGPIPGDESWSVNRIIIKEINDLLNYKCSRNIFLFVEQCNGWTQENRSLDYSLFYKDSLHLLEKGNTKRAKFTLAPIINPVYSNTVIDLAYYGVECFLFKKGDFSPLKPSSSYTFKSNILHRS